jgi:hypothetical protein
MQPFERSLKEASFMGWPAFALRQGPLRLHVVPAIGGRLMGIEFEGVELCFVNPALCGQMPADDPAAWAALCGDWGFPLWGGGKTWLAPESAWPRGAPHRDLDSGAWTVTERWCDLQGMGIELRSPVCRDSALQLRRRLSLPNHGTAWRLEHGATNRGDTPITFGLWDVLMLQRPARVSLPRPGALATTAWASAVHALPGKPPVEALRRDGVLRARGEQIDIACDAAREFKCGFDSRAGEIQAERTVDGGTLRYQRRSRYPRQASFAHEHPLEVFNAPRLPYFEIETHSPLATLAPATSCAFAIEEAVLRLPATPEGDSP